MTRRGFRSIFLHGAVIVSAMNMASDKLKKGFRLHDRTVFPSRNIVRSPSGEQHIEPKAMQVLLVLATEAGNVVSRDRLLEVVWPDTYSGDAALTRCVSMLRSSLGEGKGQKRYIETVSKSGYRLVAPVIELETGTPAEPKARVERRKFPGFAVFAWLGLAAIIAASLSYYWTSKRESAVPERHSAAAENVAPSPGGGHAIAVLPFANMSGDPANEYLSDGISEEILNVLGQVPKLRVTSRSSSFSFRETNLPLSEIAGKLGVDSILEGSVRKFGDQIRISVQLIEAKNDVLLWSETYDREFGDVLRIQDEIAKAVTATLKDALDIEENSNSGPRSRVMSTSTAAHEAFLRGRYLAAKRTKQSLEAALDEFNEVLSIEPDHAAAMSELAITYILLRKSQYGDLTEAEALQPAQNYASRAMELNPGLAEANAASGLVAWRKGLSADAERYFKQALEINPNYAIVYNWLSMLQYRNLGEHAAGFAASKISRLLDPVSIPSATIYIQHLISRGLFEEAAVELEKLKSISMTAYLRMQGELDALGGLWANPVIAHLDALLIDPQLTRARIVVPVGLFRLGIANETPAFRPPTTSRLLILLDRVDEALELAEQNLQSDPESAFTRRDFAVALVYAGQPGRAHPYLEELWQLADRRAALISTHFFALREALSLHAARRADGDESGAEEIIAAMRAEIQRARAAGISVTRRGSSLDFSEGIADYLSGNRETGLALIAKAVNDGFYIRPSAPYFQPLFADPDFSPILAVQEAKQARERSRLLEIVCHDNPYKAVWQPSENTCLN